MSRRDFFKTVGAGSMAAALATPRRALARQGLAAVGPGDVPVTLILNGQRHQVRIEPRVTLLDAMRTRLGVTGAKRVCDRGVCGACTVIIGGRTCHACSLLAIESQDKDIRTVEGLSSGAPLHPVQRAFCEQDASMCGFCTPGCVMSAVALLERMPAPTVAQAKRALDGHLCRCGADLGILAAVAAGARGVRRSGTPPMQEAALTTPHPRYAWPSTTRVLGTRVPRVDGPRLTTGRAVYTADVLRPGLIYGRLLRSPHPHARVKTLDLAPALEAPGVRAALALVQPGDKVLYAGEDIAAVAAQTEDQAADAVRLIRVEWEVLPHLATVEESMRPEAPHVFAGGNTRVGPVEEDGDVVAAFAAATHVTSGVFSTQVQTHHVSPETHGCVCEWNGDRLTAWVSTQAVHATREGFAVGLGLPRANVRVIAEHIGGGFGSKFGPDVQGLTCARLAHAARTPVKLMLDRKEEHLATGNRPSAFARVQAAVSADGLLTGFEADTWGTGGAGAGAHFPLPYLYRFPNRRRVHADVFINAGRQRAMRAGGHPQGCFITEVIMDELADAIRLDPMDLRLRNLPPPAANAMWRRYFPIGAERIGWSRRHPTGDPTPGPIKRGLGCAAARWSGSGQGARAQCEIYPDGRVLIRAGTQDIGTGTRTVMALVTAETLGLGVDQIQVELGDSALPFSGGSGGSATTASVAPAVRVAAGLARDQLCVRIAPGLKTTPDRLVVGGGRVAVRDATRAVGWRDACTLLGARPVSVEGAWEPGLSASGTSGVQFADVEVDIETGITRVVKVVCVQDCGLIVNALAAESQCCGGVIGGVNYALMEARHLDRTTGVMVNPNMEWYLMAGPSDIPEIDVVLVDQPERGVIGIGEAPAIATAAAVANAVRNATGVSIRSLPITPDTLLAELERAGGTN